MAQRLIRDCEQGGVSRSLLMAPDIPRPVLLCHLKADSISTSGAGKVKEEKIKTTLPTVVREEQEGEEGMCFELALFQDALAARECHRSAAWAPGYK